MVGAMFYEGSAYTAVNIHIAGALTVMNTSVRIARVAVSHPSTFAAALALGQAAGIIPYVAGVALSMQVVGLSLGIVGLWLSISDVTIDAAVAPLVARVGGDGIGSDVEQRLAKSFARRFRRRGAARH